MTKINGKKYVKLVNKCEAENMQTRDFALDTCGLGIVSLSRCKTIEKTTQKLHKANKQK